MSSALSFPPKASSERSEREPTLTARISAELLERWLFWAGAKLVAMPSERIKPAEPKAIWPEYGIDRYQILEFRQKLKVRIPPPSNDEIPIMDEILLFPNLCEYVNRRRAIHLRLLTNPITLNPINSWNKIAGKLHTSVPKAKRFYYSGITETLAKLSDCRVRRIAEYFAEIGNL